jgi:hypothetical protein
MNNSSAAAMLLVASPEQLMHTIVHRRSGPASRLPMTLAHYHRVMLTNPDIFKLLNIEGIYPYTQPRTVKEGKPSRPLAYHLRRARSKGAHQYAEYNGGLVPTSRCGIETDGSIARPLNRGCSEYRNRPISQLERL